jgi:gliding motility-associated-like protein
MLKRHLSILLIILALPGGLRTAAQIADMDYVCSGQTKHYWVNPDQETGSTYAWWVDGVLQQGNISNEIDYTWIVPGTHMLEVQETSSFGCIGDKRSIQITVYPLPEQPVVSVNQPTCIIKSGKITVSSPAEVGLTYSIDGTNYSNTTGVFSSLEPGTYSVTAKSVNGCISPATIVTINDVPEISNNFTTEVSDYNGYNISCYGQSDGYIDVITSDDITSYAFEWSGPGGFSAHTSEVSGLPAGKYVLLITDKNLCSAVVTTTLTQPESLLLNFVLTEPLCPDTRDGEIKLQVSGGVPDYEYLWSDNSTSSYLTGITSGYYNVVVKDMNQCTIKGSVNLMPQIDACIKPPEAFSPNGDLINDVWLIENIEHYPEAEVTIYNRWGQAIWRSERGYPVPWDGRSRGIPVPIDSYHYVIDLHNGSRPIAGFVTLVK